MDGLQASFLRIRPQFIGCATDAKLVEPTAVMLTSVDINGQTPDAVVLVACFSLSEEEKRVLRIGAGGLGARMRCIDVQPDMFHGVDLTRFTEEYPPAVLGRLLLADCVDAGGARLLTLDSDMIVNGSLLPLFELDLGSEYFAAVHDPPRADEPNYFNSGVTLCEVDTYRYHNVARRCLTYIAERRPHFPDQDALNDVVGDSWWRLDPLWNYFCEMGREFTPADYELAKIAHFPGWKPWNHAHHPGHALYARYLREHRLKMDRAHHNAVNKDFIASCYEVFLGRELESDAVVQQRGAWTTTEILRSVIGSSEFWQSAARAVCGGGPLPANLFNGRPTLRQRYWAAGLPGLSEQGAPRVEAAQGWLELLSALLNDPGFARVHGDVLPQQ